jgi:hypothetical protein
MANVIAGAGLALKVGTMLAGNRSKGEALLDANPDLKLLDIDEEEMGDGIGALILDPLQACMKVQTKLNDQYIVNVLKLCEMEYDDSDTVSVRTARLAVGDTTMDIPLLTLVQPAQLAVTTCHIDFTAEVTNSMEKIDKSSSKRKETTKTDRGFWGRFVGKRDSTVVLSSANSSNKTLNSTKKNLYTVSVKAETIENRGMIFLQELLKTSLMNSTRHNTDEVPPSPVANA